MRRPSGIRFFAWLWKALDKQLKQIDHADLKNMLRLICATAERQMNTKFHKKGTRNGKKAWLKARLYFVTRRVILDTAKGLNVSEKVKLFNTISYYTLVDSELTDEHFSRKPLRALISLINRKGLERTFTMALWSSRRHGRRLFRKITWIL